MDVFEEIVRLRKAGRVCAFAVITACSGSTPRKEGTRMLVRDDGTTAGSLGGGVLEAMVVREAVEAMKDRALRTVTADLAGDGDSGGACGGRVQVVIDPVVPDAQLVVIGAGHVGTALARVARFSGFRVVIADDRRDFLEKTDPEGCHDYETLVIDDYGDALRDIRSGPDTFIVVCTRSHKFDLDALRGAICTGAPYIGVLGSRRKRRMMFDRLRRDAFSEEDLERVKTPVGLSIGARTPEEIAVSIAAELIQFRHRALHDQSLSSCCDR
ncbi:MAG TPA: XdhC family protein [Thermodesulfobacteriaceae bacterium]|nr:XdhC family protein [Thermodesulfobacteriaceae bacterium]